MNSNSNQTKKQKDQTRRSYWPCLALLAVLVLTVAIRLRLLDIPLERDEGEHAYAAQIILDGSPPYAEVYNMIMPGVDFAYTLILAVFGQSLQAIHFGLLLINAAVIILLFLLAKQLFNPLAAAAAASAFALLSLGQQVRGFSANTEHFVIFFAVAGLLLLVKAANRQKPLTLFAAALLLGLSFIMKQHAAAFIVFAGLYLFFNTFTHHPFNKKSLIISAAVFLSGVLLPFLITCFVLWCYGVFEKFWFFTFTYNIKYVSSFPPLVGLSNLKMQLIRIAGSAVSIWLLAGCGLAGLLYNKKAYPRRIFVIGFLLFSFLSVCPGFYFRRHYFILLLPAVSLLAGLGTDFLCDIFTKSRSKTLARTLTLLLIIAVLFHTLYQQRKYFFITSPEDISRKTYGLNPFHESLQIAEFIKNNSTEDDRIAVLGSEPQICFYSNRRSATGYIYIYPLMENTIYALQMQKEMIHEIETALPKFLIFVEVPTSWMARPGSNKTIFNWFRQFHPKYYEKVGVIDMLSFEKTVYKWGPQARDYSPRSTHWISIFELKK